MKPNVILINADDLGYGDLGCYASEVNDTPYLNEMAENGTVFTSNYSASAICTPSRAGLMTGCYPPRVSVNRVLFPGEAYGLCREEYTMGNLFKDSGYKTMIIGKWHLGDQSEFLPCNFGFDDYYGLPFSNDMGRQMLADGTVSEYPPLPLMSGNEVIEEQPDQCSLTERYTEKAVDFIRKNKENNFFLYLAHMHVHLPLYSHQRFVDESKNGDFGACVAELDWSCGVIMNEIKKLGLSENTLIIFTSDNGSKAAYGASNYPLRGNKFQSWEGGFRVPFIAMWEGKIKANHRSDKMISHMDLLPTFADILGAELPDKKRDGKNILATLTDDEAVREDFVYFTYRVKDGLGLVAIDAVRKGDYKLFFNRADTQTSENTSVKELYNLKEDISESVNIYDENPLIVAELTEIFEAYQKTLGNYENNITGCEVRPYGIVENPVPLTVYDENHPYIVSYYDKGERG